MRVEQFIQEPMNASIDLVLSQHDRSMKRVVLVKAITPKGQEIAWEAGYEDGIGYRKPLGLTDEQSAHWDSWAFPNLCFEVWYTYNKAGIFIRYEWAQQFAAILINRWFKSLKPVQS